MTQNTHTPGPWKAQCPTYNDWHVYSANHPVGVVANLRGSFQNELTAANAARIVACVNACEGIDNPEAVGELVERGQALETAARRYAQGHDAGPAYLLKMCAKWTEALKKAGVR